MTLSIRNIYRYPVKGLSAEPLDSVCLSAGLGLPQDRRFAIAHSTTKFDPSAPEWLPKTNFAMLMRNARLAKLNAVYDDESGVLTLLRDGKQVARGDITSRLGCTLVGQFLSAFLGQEIRGAARIIDGGEHMFSDHKNKVVSIIGLASLSDIERVAGDTVHPLRFRANFYFDGGKPWQEFDWVGKEIEIGDTRLAVTSRIVRCAATNVNPETAEGDLNIPLTLQRGFGHVDTGVYARVITPGSVREGDKIKPCL